MKNKKIFNFLVYLIIFFNKVLLAESIKISSKNITLDKDKNTTIFENQVSVTTNDGDNIKSEYAEYNKEKGILILKDNISLIDKNDNNLETNFIQYNELDKTLITKGATQIITTNRYVLSGENLFIDKKNIIFSNKNTSIIDKENNQISLDNFRYNTEKIFLNQLAKSASKIKIIILTIYHKYILTLKKRNSRNRYKIIFK